MPSPDHELVGSKVGSANKIDRRAVPGSPSRWFSISIAPHPSGYRADCAGPRIGAGHPYPDFAAIFARASSEPATSRSLCLTAPPKCWIFSCHMWCASAGRPLSFAGSVSVPDALHTSSTIRAHCLWPSVRGLHDCRVRYQVGRCSAPWRPRWCCRVGGQRVPGFRRRGRRL